MSAQTKTENNSSSIYRKTTDSALPQSLSSNLTKNKSIIKKALGISSDVVIRDIIIGKDTCENKATLIFVEGLVDHNNINENILNPLMSIDTASFCDKKYDLQTIKDIITIDCIQEVLTFQDLYDSTLSGNTILLMPNSNKALSLNTKGWESRGISEPKTEAVVRGPREGFTETIRYNTALLRRKIKDHNLVMEKLVIGEVTKTTINIAYIKGIVNPALIDEIKNRLSRIKTDAILESGYIEEYIEDNPFSPFSTVANSEKPDVVAAKILEGRAAIFVDGTPFVLTVPMLFIESFQSAEDYYSRAYYTSIVRSLRFLSFLISILSPATYVALTTFHHELIPTPLLITMASAHEGIPFPSVIEVLGMGMVFEILREAGVRLPRPIGQTVSIVGALVLGEAAVTAGLVSAPVVIVIGITAIASFVTPSHADVAPILRLFLTISAGFMGGFGIIFVLLATLIHLCTLRSFGIPYFSPLEHYSPDDLKDVFVRFPMWAMINRPDRIGKYNRKRQKTNLMPGPNKQDS